MANICKKATIRIVVALLLAAYDNSYKKETNNALGNGKTQHLRGTKSRGRSGTLPPSPGKWFLKNKSLSQLRVNRTLYLLLARNFGCGHFQSALLP